MENTYENLIMAIAKRRRGENCEKRKKVYAVINRGMEVGSDLERIIPYPQMVMFSAYPKIFKLNLASYQSYLSIINFMFPVGYEPILNNSFGKLLRICNVRS